MINVYTRLLIGKQRKRGVRLSPKEVDALLEDRAIKDKFDAAQAERDFTVTVVAPRKDLTWEYVSERLGYNPETGVVYWKKSKSHFIDHGKEAGTITGNGYRQISLDYKPYSAHRIAWLLYYKEWPVNQIDHINRDRLDNRISNLRDVTAQENVMNQARFHDQGERQD